MIAETNNSAPMEIYGQKGCMWTDGSNFCSVPEAIIEIIEGTTAIRNPTIPEAQLMLYIDFICFSRL